MGTPLCAQLKSWSRLAPSFPLLLLAFSFSLPLTIQGGKICFWDLCGKCSGAERSFCEGNVVRTFCMFSRLPIRVFLSGNANRPEIECISKCNREVKCIFSKYG